MSPIAAIDIDALHRHTGDAFGLLDLTFERVSIIGRHN